MIDAVFNHVGRDFFAFKDVQQNGPNSQYCSWFQNLNFGGRSPLGDNFWYEGWAGHYELVKLNLQNPQVRDYLIDCVNFWIDEFDIDGLRLDAADVMDVNFFKQLRDFTRNKKSDFWMYGEMVGGDYNRICQNDGLNSVTNYECYKGLYSSHNDHNYFEIAHSLQRQFGNGGIYKNIYTYNFADNHDVNRVASSVNDQRHLQNIYTIMYCMPGVPSIYYGGEWAVQGKRTHTTDHELRPCLDIDNIPNPNNELCNFLCRLGKVRTSLEALKYGDFENIVIKNEQLVFRRRTSAQTVYIALNLSDYNNDIGFNVDGNFVLTDVLNNNEKFDANGYIVVSVPPHSSRILVPNNGDFEIDYNSSAEIVNPAPVEVIEEAPAPQKLMPLDVKLGKYKHFKGNEYEVIGFATHSESNEKMVLYKSLYTDELWVRPYDMFAEVIEKDGVEIHRFEPIE